MSRNHYHCSFQITAEHLSSSLTVIFPLQLLLDLLGADTVRAHESQQPLLQVGRRAETERTDSNSTGTESKEENCTLRLDVLEF